jgi:hypothetical protein
LNTKENTKAWKASQRVVVDLDRMASTAVSAMRAPGNLNSLIGGVFPQNEYWSTWEVR